ncbi:MAG: DUF1579 domain-containing protein [bacterium]
MKKYLIIIFVFGFSLNMFAQEQEIQMSAEQKAWMEYMTPGDEQKRMANLAGEWKAEIKMWMLPDTEAMVSEGKVINEMILGGRYLQSKHSGIMMGQPMEGLNIEGFDNATKEYKSVWIDNMGTGIMTSAGKYDAESKSIIYYGLMVDPIEKKEVKIKEIVKNIDNDTQFFELFIDAKGTEFKTMEIKMTRVK